MSTVYWIFCEYPPGWEEAQVANGLDFLSRDERSAWQALRFSKRRSERLFGRYAAKALLEAAGLERAGLEIGNDEQGAPVALLHGTKVDGSLTISHRERAAFCAWCPDGKVSIGADVEWIEPRLPVFVTDYLTQGEQARMPQAERDEYVNLIWSAKEAVLKAERIGLKTDPLRVDIVVEKLPGDIEPWKTFSTTYTRHLAGFWHRKENFVLTLAILGTAQGEPLRLVEIQAE